MIQNVYQLLEAIKASAVLPVDAVRVRTKDGDLRITGVEVIAVDLGDEDKTRVAYDLIITTERPSS